MPIAAASMTPEKISVPTTGGSSPSISQPAASSARLATANTAASTAQTTIGHGRSPGAIGCSAARTASSFSRERA